MKKVIYIFLLLLIASNVVYAQRIVSYKAADGLEITADFYDTYATSNKYMLMFHQAEYSRAEYQQIASRIIKLDINCIAVDLRYGNEVNYVNNETAMSAKVKEIPHSMIDCEKDILASIDYVYSIDSTAEIFLMGSSFSGSLCLKIAKDKGNLAAVIAYSPGEFFNEFVVGDYIKGLETPTYVACTRSEYEYVSKLVSGITSNKRVLFKPSNTEGEHGAKTLWWTSKANEDCWLSLLFFLKDFK